MDQTVAASSPAEVDVFRGEQPTLDEYNTYRRTGEAPARFKPAEPADTAPADAPKVAASEGDEPESEGDSDAPRNQQEKVTDKKPHLTAQQRIAQVEANIEKIWQQDEPDTVKIAQLYATIEKIEQRAGLKRKADPAPATQPAPAQSTAAQQPQYTRPKPTAEDKNQDGSAKYSTYEDFVEELADWKAEQRWVGAQREAAAQTQAKELATKVADAHARYGDAFEASRDAFTKATLGPHGEPLIPVGILSMVSDSDILTDLVHMIGSDPDDLAKFVKMARSNPRAAILHIATVEGEIRAELAGTTDSVKPTPAPPKTQAPKPPSPVSAGSSRAFDVSDESLSNEAWAQKRNKQLERKG